MNEKDICYWSASKMAESILERQISAVELIDVVLKRVERINPAINAYSSVAVDQAFADAEKADLTLRQGTPIGVLHGVPVSIKDVIHTSGILTTCGSRLYEGHVPTEDAIVVDRLKRAGAIVIGKTNTPEFGHLPVTNNSLYGETRNPWDLSRTSGGSSGGCGAAVAAGLGPISIGNDGGGSVRIPAALCGVVGFKPTFGVIPQYPRFPGWNLLGHTGPLARNVADIKLVMDVVGGPDIRDPDSMTNGAHSSFEAADLKDLKIGWTLSLNDIEAVPEVALQVSNAAKLASEIGSHVEQVALDWSDPEQHFRVLVASEMTAALGSRSMDDMQKTSPTLDRLVKFGATLSAVDYVRALDWRLSLARRIFEWFSRFDVLLLPVTPIEAFPVGQIGPKEISGRKVSPFAWTSWTSPFNLTRQPALSLPCGLTSGGLPVGVQIVARYGADDLLLRVAGAVESLLRFNARFLPDEAAMATIPA